jgi:ABC-type uncharacterized transport system permease subunit
MTKLETVLLYAGLIWYAAAAVSAFLATRTADRRRLNLARVEAFLGASFHLSLLAVLGARTGHFPIASAFQAFLFLSTAVVAVSLALDWLRDLPILVVAALPLAFVTALLAILLAQTPGEAVAASPNPPGIWTSLHIFVALGSYGAFALAFVTGILYLVEQRQLKHHAATSALGLMPSLETVSHINVGSIAAGVGLLLVGLLVGYFRARDLYHRQFNRVDPKIILTTLTLVAYLAILVLSARPAFKGRRTAMASVATFFLLMANFWASIFWSDIHRFR